MRMANALSATSRPTKAQGRIMGRLPLTLVTALALSSPGYAQPAHRHADRARAAWRYEKTPGDRNWAAQQESFPTTIWMGRNRVTVQSQGLCGPDPLNCSNSANGG
jgi:hypothetical protein